ncbi:DUF3862 domain-containing protein [Heyndrickxia coagulans]|uniref:DUF3862 domain-containing protein n=1 Tax=Heyndrickxia coagulans TaxID=1398 RepID=UPI000792AB0B|nr:DUF3862 domain-containing protein [Heyndrickxia coagulans]KYC67226.1 hypothetical protein B4100_3862 [Heyndrickxia coagulans]
MNKATMSKSEFSQIKTGMTYNQVVKIVGSKGELQSESGDGEYKTQIYEWKGEGDIGANANVTFQGGKVEGKAQMGLK